VPVVGNVKLVILSERMVKNGSSSSNYRSEKLIVRWKTCGKTKIKGTGPLYRGISGSGDQVDKITEFLGGDVPDDEEFSGLFIFEFDEDGRIVTHTIEHAQQGGSLEKMTRVVSVMDWLAGKAKWRRAEEPSYAFCEKSSTTFAGGSRIGTCVVEAEGNPYSHITCISRFFRAMV